MRATRTGPRFCGRGQSGSTAELGGPFCAYHFDVFEGPGLDAAPALAGHEVIRLACIPSEGVRLEHAVAGHAAFATIEVRRIDGVVCALAPVPIGLVAGVSAFVAQGLFIHPRIVAMPGQEIRLDADGSEAGSRQPWDLLTVPWMMGVCWMCVATKSSKRFWMPGTWPLPLGGLDIKHRTAFVYALRSATDKVDLALSQSSCSTCVGVANHSLRTYAFCGVHLPLLPL